MTTKIQHTPGPWTRGKSANGRKAVFAECRGTIPIAYVGGNGQPIEIEYANANLICAAPDMYAALKDWIRMEDEGPHESGISPLALYTRARAALAKAEGKAS